MKKVLLALTLMTLNMIANQKARFFCSAGSEPILFNLIDQTVPADFPFRIEGEATSPEDGTDLAVQDMKANAARLRYCALNDNNCAELQQIINNLPPGTSVRDLIEKIQEVNPYFSYNDAKAEVK